MSNSILEFHLEYEEEKEEGEGLNEIYRKLMEVLGDEKNYRKLLSVKLFNFAIEKEENERECR